ncbi:MAG: DUF364 domain-containing protein [Clostridia bacterium]|nr:DUF364 domain-containing protein [Clostridia bacterium]
MNRNKSAASPYEVLIRRGSRFAGFASSKSFRRIPERSSVLRQSIRCGGVVSPDTGEVGKTEDMSMIIDELIQFATPETRDQTVKDIRIGLGYTCVELSGGGCGLAYTFRNDAGHTCSVLGTAGTLLGLPAADMLTWAKSDNKIKAALGLATMNALMNRESLDMTRANVADALVLKPQDTFGMVGAFRPILKEIRSRVGKIFVFEEEIEDGSGFYPSEDIPRYLPNCDVIILTATSLINGTIDSILTHCRGAREVCLVGPSTPMCSAVFSRYGITLLAGSLVTRPDLALEIVSQGGGTRNLRPAIEHVLLKI